MTTETKLGIYMLVTQLIGIAAGSRYLSTPISQGTPLINKQAASGLYLVAAIALATGLMLLLYKFNLTALIKTWFYSALFLTTLIFFIAFMPAMLALGTTIAVFIVRQLTPTLWTRNWMDAFAYAGAGALFGAMIGPIPAAIFLIVLAVYDTVAVFMTGHMVSMAESSIESNTFMGIMYPKDGAVQTGDIELKPADRGTATIGVLGGGDIVAPTLYSISLMTLYGPLAALLSTVGATAGLMYLFHWTGDDSFYPAIPFITAGSFTGTAVYFLVTLL